MLFIVGKLHCAAARRLVDGLLHGVCNLVGIHYDSAVEVSGRTSDSLRQRSVAAQEAFLVGIEYGHKRYFRQVEAFAEEVHADKHIEFAGPQPVENPDAVKGVDIAVDVGSLYADLCQIVVQLLGHALGQGGDQHSLVTLDAQIYLMEKVVDLVE